MYNRKNKILTRVAYTGIVVIISIVLTIFSMDVIKNVPGNGFATEMEFVATVLLVFGLWFLGIVAVVWSVGFLINLARLKKNPSGADVKILVEKRNKDIKIISILKKIIIGILNVACIYFFIVFSLMACVFSSLAVRWGEPSGIVWLIFALSNVFILLSLLVCGVSDFIMMIKLKRNPYNQKTINIRKKGRRRFWILVVSYVLLYICFFVLGFVIF